MARGLVGFALACKRVGQNGGAHRVTHFAEPADRGWR